VAVETEFGLLGPLLVRRAGRTPEIPLGKQRALLAALLLNANRVVPIGEIAEVLWGDEPPASARMTIQNYIKRLRKALDGDDARIATAPLGYLIRVEPGELDVSRFAAAQEAARRSARQGDWELAAAQLREALSLWRGEPLADAPSQLLAQRHVPRLAEMRLQAVEARIDADLHLRRHADVIAELRLLAGSHPLRERLHALLMLALYRDGQQGEALAAYQRARRALLEELGVEPGPELRQLEGQVLNADPALQPFPASDGHRAPAAAPPRQQTPAGPPRQLPAPVRHFAGRSRELGALTRLIDLACDDAPSTVVISAISGTAGVGKTALAVHWAHQVAGRFPDGQLYVNLRGYDPGQPMPAADALAAFLRALGVAGQDIPAGQDERAARFRSLLADRRMLVVLDNARHADQVRPLLPGGAGSLVLVTSRSQLAGLVAAEGAHPVTLDLLSEADALQLLARRVGPERIAAEPGAAAELIALCARLPLALAIAAARAALHPDLSLAALASELRDARGRLDALDAGDSASSVRVAFSWSYRHLPGQTARIFRLLGVHPGPDITAAATASLAGVTLADARRALPELTRANLLDEQAPGRYAFHDLLRAYAAELASAEDGLEARQAATRRMADHYLHTACAARRVLNPRHEEITAPAQHPGVLPEDIAGYEQAMAWFDAEHRVLLAMVGHAADAGLDTHAWQLSATLMTFLYRRGTWDSLVTVQHTGLAAALRLGDSQAQAIAHTSLGEAQNLVGRYQEAHSHFMRALDLCRQAGNRVGEGRVHNALLVHFERQDRYSDAVDHGLRALSAFRAVGDKALQAIALNNTGYCHAQLGNYQQALERCQQAMTLLQELGDRNGQAFTWDSLGFAYLRLGRRDEAVDCYQRALAIARQLGDRFNQADVLTHLGDAHLATDNPREARVAWQQALDILDDLHHSSASVLREKLRAPG
jgi:DNA-binding SARP family transcriptional activator/tetratricopeptide (TPR) repeat protein